MRPKDKFDIKACKKIKDCNDEELIEMGSGSLDGWEMRTFLFLVKLSKSL